MAPKKRNVKADSGVRGDNEGNHLSIFRRMTQLSNMAVDNYLKLTPQKIRLIDLLVASCLLVTILQFIYCTFVGTFPFNSFLSAVFSTGGVAVFAIVLRMQLMYPSEFKDITPERALADFLICCFVLFIGTTTFLG